MGVNAQFLDEIDSLLLPAVRQGDIECLERCLSTVTNPNDYLNRLYHEEDMQKRTLLTIACMNSHKSIIDMLVHFYKPDLEIKNNILFEHENKKQQMYTSVTVLWVAAALDNFHIVRLLVEEGADVNSTTTTNSTPLRGACCNGNLDIARYLIARGADVHIVKENNDTNLAACVYGQHLQMASYLVNELGCDVNACDSNGRSPLYDAANGVSLELVEFLLNHGARNFRAIFDQMSPLMWAAEKRRVDLVRVIAPHSSLIEQIEAEEILGSAFACTDLGDCDIEQSFEHFTRALELRLIHHLPKVLRTTTIDLFDHRQECQTIDQLKQLYGNPSALSIEGLLVRERLLGPHNSEYRFSLGYYGAVLADKGEHNQAIAFWMYELGLRQEYSIEIDSDHLRHCASVFSEMVFLSLPMPIGSLLTVIKTTVGELERDTSKFDFNFHTLLFLITIAIQFFTKIYIPVSDRREIYRLLCSINQHKYVTRADGSSLLHLCIDINTTADDHLIDDTSQYPCLLTVRTLVQCGADVNATDTLGNTPLHKLVSSWITCDEDILDFLCDHGAHLDSVNVSRETVFDVISDINTIQRLRSRMKLSLKCLCARLIQMNNIPYHGKLANTLVRFVEKH